MVWALPALADDFNPANPPDPNTKYKVEASATPYGYTSGTGAYIPGTEVTISTSAYSTTYTFSHWTKDGEYYCDQTSFRYTVEEKKTVFVAVYDYNPLNPSDPLASNEYRLYLTNNIASACSFNRTSGAKVEADNYVTVTANKSALYDFLGWYENGVKISDALSFNYLMPSKSTTLVARFEFNPINPGDPNSENGEDVAQTELGDVDEDGVIDAADIILLVQNYLNDTSSELNPMISDMNKDGVIDAADVIILVNKYLNNQ